MSSWSHLRLPLNRSHCTMQPPAERPEDGYSITSSLLPSHSGCEIHGAAELTHVVSKVLLLV